MPLENELRKRGLPVTTAAAKTPRELDPDDDEVVIPEMARGTKPGKIQLTVALVKEAVDLLKINDLAEYVHGKYMVNPHKLDGEVDAEVALKIAHEFMDHVDKDWRKKLAILAYAPHQIVVVHTPEAQVAERLHYAVMQAKAAQKKSRSGKAKDTGDEHDAHAPTAKPKAVRKPKAEAPAEAPAKPKTTRKPKAKE